MEEICNSIGIQIFLHAGTVMGALRDGAIIPHDDDIDIAFRAREDKGKLLPLLVDKFGQDHVFSRILDDGIVEVSRLIIVHITKNGNEAGQVDLFPLYRDERGWWALRNYKNGGFYGRRFPHTAFDPPAEETAMLNGKEFYIPNGAEDLLDFYYGRSINWRIPLLPPKRGKSPVPSEFYGETLPRRG